MRATSPHEVRPTEGFARSALLALDPPFEPTVPPRWYGPRSPCLVPQEVVASGFTHRSHSRGRKIR
jgi:hypothetical protein